MKRYFIIFIMFWNLFFGQETFAQEWADKARYAQANKALMEGEPDPMRVVMMGNSITEFWEETHPGFFSGNHLVCRGISGQVSIQMLARFRQDVINLHPRIVVINCGTNDIAENSGPYDEDITMDNIKSMTELALANGIQVILSSVLPCDRFIWNPSVKNVAELVRHLNTRIAGYAAEKHLPYIDYYSSMCTEDGAMINLYSDDGVHPTPAGYDVMEKRLMEVLDRIRN